VVFCVGSDEVSNTSEISGHLLQHVWAFYQMAAADARGAGAGEVSLWQVPDAHRGNHLKPVIDRP
jgi:hypothetical protein